MLYQPVKVPSMSFTLSLDFSSAHCARQKKWILHERQSRECGIEFFLAKGWRWKSPIPPSHPHVINIVIERKMKHWYLNSLQKDGIEQCHLFQKGGIGQCHLFQKDGIDQCHLFDRKVTFLHLWRCRDQGIPGYMDIGVLFFKILQCCMAGTYCTDEIHKKWLWHNLGWN